MLADALWFSEYNMKKGYDTIKVWLNVKIPVYKGVQNVPGTGYWQQIALGYLLIVMFIV